MNIKIEKFNPEDFPLFFELVSNEKVMKMITGKALGLVEAKRNFERRLENNSLCPDFGHFKILERETDEFLGLAKLEITAKNSEDSELGYIIMLEHWGKGIGGKAAHQLIAVAKEQEGLCKLYAIVDIRNKPSRKILTNNGFISREFKDFDGQPGEILELKLKPHFKYI